VERLVKSATGSGKALGYGLLGPRQIGKTSTLRGGLQAVGDRAIVVDLDFSLHRFSPEDFARALMQSLTTNYVAQERRSEEAPLSGLGNSKVPGTGAPARGLLLDRS